MTFLALHQYASVPLAASPATVYERLQADPDGLVQQATAEALTAMGPHLRRWGLRISALPTTTARPIGPEQLGGVEAVWSGAEDATGWPALSGQLVVSPAGPAGSRLRFFSRRSPHAELTTSRLDRLHRQRIVHVSIQRFLHELGRHLDDPVARRPTGRLARFDLAPMFVHALQALDGAAGAAHARLTGHLQALAEEATAIAVTSAHEPLHAGRFRAPAGPDVQTRLARTSEPAGAWVGWRGDEEATGWPQLDLALLIEETGAGGSRLAILSTREPGYDLSVPRIDKQPRDQILRSAGPAVAAAIRDHLSSGSTGPGSDRRPQLASAGR
ncbi:MAG: hypothetical protein ACNA8R_10770 [Nitriliruptoraceae bacterium]